MKATAIRFVTSVPGLGVNVSGKEIGDCAIA
jgi:hypothetical protein